MKILQINCVYAYGSTGKITADLHNELLKRKNESIVLYGRGKKINNPRVIKICGELYSNINKVWSMLTGVMYGGCFLSTNRLIKEIKKQNPDIVHLQCINGYFVNVYRLIAWLKRSHIRTILSLHAEFMYTANCGHAFECDKWKTGCGQCPRLKEETNSCFFDRTHQSWMKMKKAFDGFDDLIVTSVSPWLMSRAKQSLFFEHSKHYVVLNGLDTTIFHYYKENELIKELGLEYKKVIFHATPMFCDDPNYIKGGNYIIEVAKRLNDVIFVIAGRYPEGLKIPKNVLLLGQVYNQIKLAKLYSLANVTLITSKKETFSMVTAESLSCGTPVVGFLAGGPESIAINEYSKFIEYANIDLLISAVKEYIDKSIDKKEISENAQKKYSKDNMCDTFIKVYDEAMKRT